MLLVQPPTIPQISAGTEEVAAGALDEEDPMEGNELDTTGEEELETAEDEVGDGHLTS